MVPRQPLPPPVHQPAYMDVAQESSIEAVPQETLDEIIDELAEDTIALKACSLVSRRWVWRSRHHLFKVVFFSSLSGSKSLRNWGTSMNPTGTSLLTGQIGLAHVPHRYACNFHKMSSPVTTWRHLDHSSNFGALPRPLEIVRQGRESDALLFLMRDFR